MTYEVGAGYLGKPPPSITRAWAAPPSGALGCKDASARTAWPPGWIRCKRMARANMRRHVFTTHVTVAVAVGHVEVHVYMRACVYVCMCMYPCMCVSMTACMCLCVSVCV